MSFSTDIFLVSRVALFNDSKAFEALVKKYQSPLRRFFINITLNNKELANDLAQETFIKAYLNIGQFKGTARFSTWLYRIAYNVFYDTVKSRKITTELIDEDQPLVSHENLNIKLDIAKALKILRTEERTAIVLFYMEDLQHEKIASIMNCPLGTVKTHILRGKEKLLVYLENEGYGK